MQLPPLESVSVGDTLSLLGVPPEAWESAFQGYLAQLLAQHEEELHPNTPARTLTGDEFLDLLILAGRLGAIAGLAAIDTLLPPEPTPPC
jgi:hypothetical protein